MHELREPGAIRLERHAERVGDPLVARRLAVFLELADRGRDLARELANAARHDVAAAQLVEDGAANPMLGEREERLLARVVVAVGGLDQAEHAGGDDVLARDPVGATPRHPERDAASRIRSGRESERSRAGWVGAAKFCTDRYVITRTGPDPSCSSSDFMWLTSISWVGSLPSPG